MRLRPPVLAHLRFAERQTDLTGLAPEPLGCRRTCNVQRSELARKSCIVGHLMPERRISPGGLVRITEWPGREMRVG